MSQTSPVSIGPVTRREFLNYVWACSMALVAVGTGSVAWLFALPYSLRPKYWLAESLVPAIGATPQHLADSEVFVTHVAAGVIALDRHCTHSGCVMPYSEAQDRFACPCHGAQFTRTGVYLAGPAPRNMDWYPVQVRAPGGATTESDATGTPVPYTPVADLWVNSKMLRRGVEHA